MLGALNPLRAVISGENMGCVILNLCVERCVQLTLSYGVAFLQLGCH